MYTIGILEDNVVQAEYIKKVVEVYCAKENCDCIITIFIEPEELKKSIQIGKYFDIVFLDIDLKRDINGIDIAKWLNKYAERAQIIFLTAYLEYAIEVYETEHCYYVLKEEFKDRLPKIFEKFKNIKKYEKILLHTTGKDYIFLQDDIIYAERVLRATNIYLRNKETIQVNVPINILIEQLNPVFFTKCHNSLIVNFKHIKKMARSYLRLNNEKELPISRRYQAEIKDKFNNWARRL